MKRTEVASAINKNLPLPKNAYAIQCIEEEFVESGKGNMMVKRNWEIIDPSTVAINGQDVSVAGVQMQQYLTTVVFKDDGNGGKEVDKEKQAKMMPRVFDDYHRLGLPCDEIDPLNPHLGAKGLVARAVCGSEEYEQLKDPTPEQLAKGIKYGDPILGEDGKPVKGFRSKIIEILGLSNVKPVQLAA